MKNKKFKKKKKLIKGDNCLEALFGKNSRNSLYAFNFLNNLN